MEHGEHQVEGQAHHEELPHLHHVVMGQLIEQVNIEGPGGGVHCTYIFL